MILIHNRLDSRGRVTEPRPFIPNGGIGVKVHLHVPRSRLLLPHVLWYAFSHCLLPLAEGDCWEDLCGFGDFSSVRSYVRCHLHRLVLKTITRNHSVCKHEFSSKPLKEQICESEICWMSEHLWWCCCSETPCQAHVLQDSSRVAWTPEKVSLWKRKILVQIWMFYGWKTGDVGFWNGFNSWTRSHSGADRPGELWAVPEQIRLGRVKPQRRHRSCCVRLCVPVKPPYAGNVIRQ